MNAIARGHTLTARDMVLFPMAAGKWLEHAHLDGEPILKAGALERVQVGVYLVTDCENRIVWLGQALRDQGVAARLRDHLRWPARLETFATVRVLELNDFTPPECVSGIEGKAADVLRLRGKLGARRWPSSARWAELAI